MAHRITVFSRPHQNADGSESLAKKDWFFRDRNRSGVFISPAFGSEKAAISAILLYRDALVAKHHADHPHDLRGMKAQAQKGTGKW